MKNVDKRAREWQRMTINERMDGEIPPRICKELPECSFPGLVERQDIEKSYFLFGDTGTGKTMYAVALANEILRRNYYEGKVLSVKFITFDDILLEIRRTFDKQVTASENDIIEKYRQVDWLVLDDFGVHKQSDWAYQVLYSIINHRYEYLKSVIITSNFSLPDLATKLEDDRVISRLSVMCTPIEMSKPKRKKR